MDTLRKRPLVVSDEQKPTSCLDTKSPSPSPPAKDEDQLNSARAEMGQVREENKRLKLALARIKKDYQSLQMQFSNIRKPSSMETLSEEESVLVSLSLGTASKEADGSSCKKTSDPNMGDGLTLALDSSANLSFDESSEDPKEEDGSHLTKPLPDDEVSQQVQIKKARVSVRSRCDGQMMNDGCQWRKYGQKISKGNPCPKAYYRCTVAAACPVRKQVQRCAEDTSILITTYEGTHNHPLPMAATAMASTTAAAATMLLSGSSSSQHGVISSPSLHGLSFSLSESSRSRPPYFLPSATSMVTPPTHPTITLDLTSSPSQATAASPPQFNRFSSTFTSPTPRYSASLSFASTETKPTASPWSQLYNSTRTSHVGSIYQSSYLSKTNIGAVNATPQTQEALTDTLAKALTADPSFKSALAAALTSIVGGGQASSQSGVQPLVASTAGFADRLFQASSSSSFSLQPSLSLSNSLTSSSNVEKRDAV